MLEAGRVQSGGVGRCGADHDLARPGRCHESSGGVDRVADGGEVDRIAFPDRSHERHASMHARSQWDPRLVAVVTGLAHEVAGRVDRAGRMLPSGEAGDEEDHGFVSDEFVDDAVPAVDDPCGSPVEAREQLTELPGGRVLGDSCRTAHVHEQRAHLDLGAARVLLDPSEAPLADAAVERGGASTDEAHPEDAGMPERRHAELATRLRRKALEQPLRGEQAGHLAGEHQAPVVFLRVSLGHDVSRILRSVAAFRYVVADVFTDTPLAGNQLAVFTDARELAEERLQPLAREINFSETVFVYPAEGEGHARIRIFTPIDEIPFAGHPTLGTAFVLAGPLQLGEIRLETGAGVIPVRLEREGPRITFGWMTQPIPTVAGYEAEEELLAALGVDSSQLPVEVYDNGLEHVFVTLESEKQVVALEPDLGALARLPNVLGVNCFAGSGTRWKTRMFAPGGGVPEDPATGSAAGPLACHLVRHGLVEAGTEVEISQGAEISRPSTLYARVEGSPERIENVEVGGSAVIVARGEFRLD
jgi:trans-2,3-dihydro-3-hydroxyanthranilate isomerase